MDNVFSYFFAIGAGLTSGIAIIVLPILWFARRKEGVKNNHVRPY